MIDPRKAALIVIDMQNGFIDPASALCVEGAAATVPACSRALDHARELGMPVFHVCLLYTSTETAAIVSMGTRDLRFLQRYGRNTGRQAPLRLPKRPFFDT